MANPAAMEALMKIEGFRSLNKDIQTIINKSEAVKKAKKEAQKTHAKREKRAERGRKRVQIQTQTDSGEAD